MQRQNQQATPGTLFAVERVMLADSPTKTMPVPGTNNGHHNDVSALHCNPDRDDPNTAAYNPNLSPTTPPLMQDGVCTVQPQPSDGKVRTVSDLCPFLPNPKLNYGFSLGPSVQLEAEKKRAKTRTEPNFPITTPTMIRTWAVKMAGPGRSGDAMKLGDSQVTNDLGDCSHDGDDNDDGRGCEDDATMTKRRRRPQSQRWCEDEDVTTTTTTGWGGCSDVGTYTPFSLMYIQVYYINSLLCL
ncbi:hypothetical protein EDB83DRAFT_2314094 [Lactarius deliciosus]|nr:hypothetical protein EDB83DRAFT_2314094 [Lactarius deliciosus]